MSNLTWQKLWNVEGYTITIYTMIASVRWLLHAAPPHRFGPKLRVDSASENKGPRWEQVIFMGASLE